MTDLITADLVRLDADLGSDKHDVIRALARVVDGAGRATDVDQLVEDAFAREAKSATGLPAASRSRTAAPPASRSRPWPSRGSRRRSTSAPRTARPTWSS